LSLAQDRSPGTAIKVVVQEAPDLPIVTVEESNQSNPATLTIEQGSAFAILRDKQEGDRYYAQIKMFSPSEMRDAHEILTTAHQEFRPPKTLPFGRLWHAELNAVGNAKFRSRSHDAVIRVYDEAGKRDRNARARGRFQRVVSFLTRISIALTAKTFEPMSDVTIAVPVRWEPAILQIKQFYRGLRTDFQCPI
jgi:hypothetical protein